MRQCYVCHSRKTAISKYGTESWQYNYDCNGDIIHYLCSTCAAWINYLYKHSKQKHLRYINRFCYSCDSTDSKTDKTGCKMWYKNHDEEDSVLCNRCERHLFPESNRAHQRKIACRKINFLGKYILLSFQVRFGICSICKKTVMSGQLKVTDMQHRFYLPICPWFSIIELCRPCHRKEEWRLGTANIDGFKIGWKYGRGARKNLSKATT